LAKEGGSPYLRKIYEGLPGKRLKSSKTPKYFNRQNQNSFSDNIKAQEKNLKISEEGG